MSFEAAIAFARDLIRIPSLPGQEGELAARVLAEYENLGFDDVWSDPAGNCFARVKGAGSAPAVMLNCHLDAVDVGEPQSWEHPPFAAVVADGFLHGRGAMDIKGPLALQTHAAAQFLEHRPAGDLIVGHTVFEERGGWGMEYFLTHGDFKPGAVIIGEATDGDICVGHRGRAEIIVEVQGLAGHASAPQRARNPIELLPEILPRLQQFAARLGDNAVLGRSTIAPTALETLPRSRNVIPDRARVILDWRVLPGTTPDSAVADVSAALRDIRLPDGFMLDVRFSTEAQRTYTGLERERRMFTPGFLIDPDHVVVRAAVATVQQQTGRAPQLRPWTFATDGGHACGVHGIPCIGYAPGEERYAHTNTERLRLDPARQVYQVYPHLIKAVQQSVSE